MPELPEVETITRQLNQTITGKTILTLEVFREKSFEGKKEAIIGKQIIKASRRAKIIILTPDTKWPKILIHLKMTGQLIYVDNDIRVAGGHPSADWLAALPNKYTRVRLDFKEKGTLFFNDLRTFGWIKVVETEKEFSSQLMNVGGIEPLTTAFTRENLHIAFAKSRRPIKLVLMDQKIIAGVGNIYANDALWSAGISPWRPANSLSLAEIEQLRKSLNQVIELGIKYGGTSQSDYRQLMGQKGSYQDFFLVYHRDTHPCKRCGRKVSKAKLGGRGTFFCSQCQK
jgi:formamidopyrimidine-DNA glycosylase